MNAPLVTLGVLVAAWVITLGPRATRTRRFVAVLAAWSALLIAALVLFDYDTIVLNVFVLAWTAAWFGAGRLGLGWLRRSEEQFDGELRQLLHRLRELPDREEYEGIVTALEALRPPSAEWAHIRDLLVDHARERLEHANVYFLPDMWRLDRVKELWDRLLLRRVLWERRAQTPDEFDAQLSEALDRIEPMLSSIGASARNAPGMADASMQAHTLPAQQVIADIQALAAPTPQWATVKERLVAALNEELQAVIAGENTGRTEHDRDVRELQKLWAAARRG